MSEEEISLVQSALAGDSARVNEALESGVAVDTTERGRTSLHHAAVEGHLDVVKVLLNWKADVNKRSKAEDDNGGTPLHLAAEEGHADIMELLVSAGADAEAIDLKGRRASHRAASRGQLEALQLLQEIGCDLNARDNGKATPIHHAAYFGDLDVVKWLSESGVYLVLKDKNGRLAKDVAKKYGHNNIHRFLKESASKKGTFGTAKARKSMRDSSSLQRPVHRPRPMVVSVDSVKSSPPATEQEKQMQPDLNDTGSSHVDQHVDSTSMVSSTRKHSTEDARPAEGSLTPPDSPLSRMMESRVVPEPRRRTWSLRSSRGRSSLKSQVDELIDVKERHEEELQCRDEEITRLKNNFSRLENEKVLVEEQLRETRLHVDHQQKQLAETVSLQQQIQQLALQNDEYQSQLNQNQSEEAKVLEREAVNKHTIETLKREVERLSLQLRSSKENLLQTQEALRQAEVNSSSTFQIESLQKEIEHLTCMLSETGHRALSNQEKMEQKIATLKERDESHTSVIEELTEKISALEKLEEANKNTIVVLSEKLREAEARARSDQIKLRVAEEKASVDQTQEERLKELIEQDATNKATIASLSAQMSQLAEQDGSSKATIASLSAKVQQMTQTIGERDNKTLAVHKQQQARIEELIEENESKQKTISALTMNLDQLNQKLKERQEHTAWYQNKLKQKEKEVEERDYTITGLQQEVDDLTQRLQESEQQKTPFSQYERGGTMVALQKQEAANKQTIKALENRLHHLTTKMKDSEKASLDVQREQLDTIASLRKELEQLKQKEKSADAQTHDDPEVHDLMEENLQKSLVIEALNKKVDKLNEELKKNFMNFSSWQTQQQEKDREAEQREAESHHTITSLRQELDQLTQERARAQQQQQQQQQQMNEQHASTSNSYSSLPHHQVNHTAHTNRYQPRNFIK
ncbi:hypothetical protein OTU49_010264 [Cherax quadricarinatus]|uniref:Uncharacterized protein n=1 Tax=Cherax quadricarinatus TaxID=27406 RepID=A0AAW0YJD1_CHEQU